MRATLHKSVQILVTRLPLFALAFIAFSAASQAPAQGISCQQVFSDTSPLKAFTSEELKQKYPPSNAWDSGEILKFTGHTIRYELGGKLRTITTTTGAWSSSFKAFGQDVIGYPLNLATSLGAKLAYTAGFRKVSETEITIPDAEALNSFIKDANKRLQARNMEPLALHFYETTAAQPLTGQTYLTNFIHGALPLEKAGSIGIHDISFHASSFLMPKELVRAMQLRAKMAVDFANILKDQNDPTLQPIIDFLIAETVKRIDLTGNYVSTHAWNANKGKYDPHSITVVTNYLGLHKVPTDFIKSLLERANFDKDNRPLTQQIAPLTSAFIESQKSWDEKYPAQDFDTVHNNIIPAMSKVVENLNAVFPN